MGFFSWKTIDSNESITNTYSTSGALAVVLLVPNEFGGIPLIEKNYEGYGVFGAKDAYALLAQWNKPEVCSGKDTEDRSVGIEIGYSEEQMMKLKYPLKFVTYNYYESTKCTYEEVSGYSKNCPYQGYFLDDDE